MEPLGPLLVQLHILEFSQAPGDYLVRAIRASSDGQVALEFVDGSVQLVRPDTRAEQIYLALGPMLSWAAPPDPRVTDVFMDRDGAWWAWTALLYDLGTFETEMFDIEAALRLSAIVRADQKASVTLVEGDTKALRDIPLDRARIEAWPVDLARWWKARHA